MTVDVLDNREENRFEIHVDGQLAGFAQYVLPPGKLDTVVFTHTEVLPADEGQGLAGRLVSHALDVTRDTGMKVVARCPYVARYIERHPGYQDLLAG